MKPTREELEVVFLATLLSNSNPNIYEPSANDYVQIAVGQTEALMQFWAERDAQEADHGE